MNDLKPVVDSALAEFAGARTPAELEDAKARFLGKSGIVTEQLKALGALPAEQKKARGAEINVAKQASTRRSSRAAPSSPRRSSRASSRRRRSTSRCPDAAAARAASIR
jgi:phenylalanyl-tRNA synthetase alpha subunit